MQKNAFYMKKKFKTLQPENFPSVSDPNKFEEWKRAGISFRKRAASYYAALYLIFAVIGITLSILNDFRYGAIQIGIYSAFAYLVSVFVGKLLAGNKFKNLSLHLGITDKMVRQVLRGKIIEKAVDATPSNTSIPREISKINTKKNITYIDKDTSTNPIIIFLSFLFILAGIYAVWDIFFN